MAEEQRILELLAGLVGQTLLVRQRYRAQSETGGLAGERLSGELPEDIQALRALVRHPAARYGTLAPRPAALLTQIKSCPHDLQKLLDDYRA